MKALITAIATLGAMTTFVGSAFADVSFSIRFGSSPSVRNYRTYDSYRSNIYQPTYQDPYYHHHHYDHSRVIVREIVPNYNYSNSWEYSTVPNWIYPVNVPATTAPNWIYPVNVPATTGSVYSRYNSNLGDRYRSGYPTNFPATESVYNPYNSNLGDRYIIERRFIRAR